MINVEKVKRVKGKVEKVVVRFDEIELTFVRGKDRFPKEISRILLTGERLYDREKLRISDRLYGVMIKQLIAIFDKDREKKEGFQQIELFKES